MPKAALPAFIAGSRFGSFFASLARGITTLSENKDVLEAGRIPNYVRGLALLPDAAKPFASAFKRPRVNVRERAGGGALRRIADP